MADRKTKKQKESDRLALEEKRDGAAAEIAKKMLRAARRIGTAFVATFEVFGQKYECRIGRDDGCGRSTWHFILSRMAPAVAEQRTWIMTGS